MGGIRGLAVIVSIGFMFAVLFFRFGTFQVCLLFGVDVLRFEVGWYARNY